MRETFEDYVKEVAKWVGGNRQKRLIEEELSDHLEDNFERFRAMGFSEAEAEQKAVQCMGKKEELRHAFAELYPVHPNSYMCSAVKMIGFGLFFATWRLDFLPYLNIVLQVIGYILLGLGLLKLRGQNKALHVAFWSFCGGTVCTAVGTVLHWWFLPEEKLAFLFSDTICLLGTALFATAYIALFCGLQKEIRSIKKKTEKDPHLVVAGTVMGVQILLSFVAAVSMFGQEKGLMPLGPFISELYLLIPIIVEWSLFRVCRILHHEEPEVEIRKPLQKRGKGIYAAVVSVCLLTAILMMPVAALRQPKATVFKPNDVTQNEAVEAAKQNMLSLGFPEERLSDLPDSEILKYKDALALYTELDGGNGFEAEEAARVRGFYFKLPDPDAPSSVENDYLVRVLYCLDGFPEGKWHMRSGFFVQEALGGSAPAFYPLAPELSDYTAYTLSEKNGKILCSAPLGVKKNAFSDEPRGMEFNFPKGAEHCRAYYAFTASFAFGEQDSSDYLEDVMTLYSIQQKKIPLYAVYENTYQAFQNRNATDITYAHSTKSYCLCEVKNEDA